MWQTKVYSSTGVIGSILIFANILFFSLITPEFDSRWQTISELNAIGSSNSLSMNAVYTIGFALLIVMSFYFLKREEIVSRIAGMLMIISFLTMIALNWFFPMDPTLNIRTSEDLVHNNVITIAVLIFLISQIFAMAYWQKIKNLNARNMSLVTFSLALVFGIASLYSNIYKSELINIAERGWMVAFLLYLLLTAIYIKRGKNGAN